MKIDKSHLKNFPKGKNYIPYQTHPKGDNIS